jgi:hypothetical protein
MATETIPAEQTAVETLQAVSAPEALLHFLKQAGYKLVKDDDDLVRESKGQLLVVTRHGRKEAIDIRGLSTFAAKVEKEKEQTTITDHLLHSVQFLADALLSSFLIFGKYFKGQKMTSALALPDTVRYRQIMEKLEDYFSENNLDFKIYLVAQNGGVLERNLNRKKNKAVVPPVVEN